MTPLGRQPGPAGTSQRPEGASLNVEKIARIEAEQALKRSLPERIGDRIVSVAGSWMSGALHVVWFGGWIAINTGAIPGIPVFDPYPFSFLTLAVSLEAIFITLAVLNAQTRLERQADRRAHLDLQVNLLAEQESTAALQLLRQIAERLGVAVDAIRQTELETETDIEDLVGELDQRLPPPHGER